MGIAIESLLFLLAGIVLAVILIQVFGRGAGPHRKDAAIKLERRFRAPNNIEETRLLINDQAILAASSEGVRLADYADEVEQLELVATRIATALGVNVELTRLPGKGAPAEEEALSVRRLPPNQQSGAA